MTPVRRVSLVLGAGGARGYAHIGAIQAIEERGMEVAGIAGSSMGALVGGIYAAGKLEEFTEWALSLTQREVLRLLDISLTGPGVVRLERVLARVRELIGGDLIEDLAVPYTAVATDLLARREVWFQRGPLDVAIRASIALPGIFPPVILNGQLLADGGLMDPIPVAPTAGVAADATIAISLGGERQGYAEGAAAVRESAEPRPFDEWVERFRRGAAQALDHEVMRSMFPRRAAAAAAAAAAADADPVPPLADGELGPPPADLTRFDVMTYSLEAMQTLVGRYRLAGLPPDVLVTVPRDACRTLDFHRAAPLIDLGRTLTARALDALESGDEPAEP